MVYSKAKRILPIISFWIFQLLSQWLSLLDMVVRDYLRVLMMIESLVNNYVEDVHPLPRN